MCAVSCLQQGSYVFYLCESADWGWLFSWVGVGQVASRKLCQMERRANDDIFIQRKNALFLCKVGYLMKVVEYSM